MRAHNFFLIVAFLAIVLSGLFIGAYTPTIRYFTFQPGKKLAIHIASPNPGFQMDLSSGAVTRSQSSPPTREWKFDDCTARLSPFQIGRNSGPEKTWVTYNAIVVGPSGSETHVSFQFPEHVLSLEMIDSSTVVCTADNRLYAIDLRSPEQVVEYPLPKNSQQITPIPNSKRIVVSPYYAPAVPERELLFDLADLSNISVIANWPTGIGITVGKDCLYEAKTDGTAISRRSLVDGSDLGDLELTKEVQSVFHSENGDRIGVHGRLLTIESGEGNLYFDMESQQRRLKLKRTDVFPARAESAQYPIQLFYTDATNAEKLFAYDLELDKEVWEFELFGEVVDFETQPGKVLLGTIEHGVCVTVLDIRNGRILNKFAPYRYSSWMLLLTEFGIAAWFANWLRTPMSRQFPPWLQIGLLAAIALTVFYVPHIAWSSTPSATSDAMGYCQGIFLGLATSGLAWFLFGKARIGIRYLPVLTVILLLIAWARFVFVSNELQSRSTVSLHLMHLAGASVAFLAVRIFGLRLDVRREFGHQDMKATETHVRPFSLADLFVLSGAVAVLIAVARPIAAFALPSVDLLKCISVAIYAIGAVIVLAGFSKRRLVVHFICGFTGLIYAVILLESLYHLFMGWPLFIGRSSMIWHYFRICATALVTNFAVYADYRQHVFLPATRKHPETRLESESAKAFV